VYNDQAAGGGSQFSIEVESSNVQDEVECVDNNTIFLQDISVQNQHDENMYNDVGTTLNCVSDAAYAHIHGSKAAKYDYTYSHMPTPHNQQQNVNTEYLKEFSS